MTPRITRRTFIAAAGALLGGFAAGRGAAAQPADFTFAAMNDLHLQADGGGGAVLRLRQV